MNQSELKTIYRNKLQKVNPKNKKIIPGFVGTTFEMFSQWFDPATFGMGCYYCGTKNERSFELYQLQRSGVRPDATRAGKRGRRLELDRKDPFLSYDRLDNLAWCCYWCNNAKSNFFSEAEFSPIARAIGEAIREIK